MIGLDIASLAIGSAVAAIVVALLGTAMAWSFHTRAARLPAATRLEDVESRLQVAREELSRKQGELGEIERMIHERDRFAAEVEVLRNQICALQAELANLEPARKEIEEVKLRAAEAAGELAELETQLAKRRRELEEVEARLDPERIAELERRKEATEKELALIEGRLDDLRAERDAALRVIAEAKQLEGRIEALRLDQERLEAEIARFDSEAAGLEAKVGELRNEVARLKATAADKAAEAEKHERTADRLRAEIASLETTLKNLEARVLAAGRGASPVDPATVIADLVREPEALARPNHLRGAPRQEAEALHAVAQHLEKSRLKYPWRTLAAFHTALKINEIAQLTVLAGVSGTGKSLLPRRYAEAMGIHFLQVAVEPRWDSPQDLLGFYNYMEGRYRATELARLMAHLDPWRSIELPEEAPDRREHMALVLLDEMNLARVEYYFSEFLSRLEARPPWTKNLSREQCADAMIPIDVRGLENPPLLFAAHNILFAGTMNEDETTQSLSDKVLDRANVLQFPAPQEFALGADTSLAPAGAAQRFAEWRSWVRPIGSLDGAAEHETRDVIGKLAAIMSDFGRPFGHRLAQAITAYVANYPVDGNAGLDVRRPLADQVEFRVLPKLRGVEIDAFQSILDRLQALLRDDLDDAAFAERLGELCERQREGTGLFAWRGLEREAG